MKAMAVNEVQQVLRLEETRDRIDTHLEQIIAARAKAAGDVHAHYKHLWESMRHLYNAGGKRLRPYATLLMYQAYGGTNVDDVLSAALAQELIHQSMLMHDDIIDRDTIRYGVKNISGQYVDTYASELTDTQTRRHFADSAAMLGGDLLIAESFLELAKANVTADILYKAQSCLHRAIFYVVGGELLDTEASFYPAGTIDPLTIAKQKTASYSFVGPLTMGAILAGASDDQLAILTSLGETVGIAYQLRDDLIGVFGDSSETGKSTDGDIREGKQTLLIEEFFKRANPEQRERFTALFGKEDASDEAICEARSLLVESGAKEAIELFIDVYKQQADNLIASLAIPELHRRQLIHFIETSLERDK